MSVMLKWKYGVSYFLLLHSLSVYLLMVILDYASTDHDHVAVSRDGFLEAIRFQSHFYGLNRTFRRLQEAVDSCRYEMDHGSLISIVVVHPDRSEVWSRLGCEIPVMPKHLLSLAVSQGLAQAQSKVENPYRNRGQATPADAYFVDAEPSPRRPLFYRGTKPYNALEA
ncbi:MAG: hypothetical protein Q6K55_05905 [Thermostichus sp. DG02_3_bins_51]